MRGIVEIQNALNDRFVAFSSKIDAFCSEKDFYEAFSRLCYGENDKDGVFFILSELLATELSESNSKYKENDFEFWINYAPYNDSLLAKSIGRLSNDEEIAYRKLSRSENIEKVRKNDSTDSILYYYKQFFTEEAIENKNIRAIQEAILDNKDIRSIYIDVEGSDIFVKIRKFNTEVCVCNDEKYHELREKIFGTSTMADNYMTYIKKIFGMSVKCPTYIGNSKDFIAEPVCKVKSFTIYNMTDSISGIFSGTVMIFSSDELFHKDAELPLYKVQSWLNSLYRLEVSFKERYNNLLIKKESIKSAKAAIMSRNMSHNLGSHVMAYLKQNLGTVQDMLTNKALSNLVDYDGNDQYRLTDINRINDIEMPFLVGVGKFIKYLQERQDYIATVATGFVPYMSSVNFKDYIYDELNADLRFLRHKKDRSGCMPSNILLDNIAKSEGYSRKSINISFRSFDGGLSLLNDDSIIDSIKSNKELSYLRTINVSLPGGVIGRQAIFSILENIIRNAAKHGRFEEGKKELVLDLDVLDLSNPEVRKNIMIADREYYKLLDESKYFDDLNSNRYLLFTVTNNQIVDDSIVRLLRDAIKEPYIEDGKMKNTNKGIKEMRISACWLRDISDDNDISKITESGEPPIILADSNVSRGLRFTFCLRKPLKVAYVGCDSLELSSQMTTFLNSKCWHRFDEEDWLKAKFVDYEIIITDKEETKLKIANHSPNRIVVLSDALAKLSIEIKNSDESDWNNVLDKTFISYWELFVKQSAVNISGLEWVCIEDDVTVMRKPNGDEYCNESNGDWFYKDKVSVANQYTNYEEISILYRKHHSTSENLQSYYTSIGEKYNPAKNFFVEGITGHNSTDRLIRNEKIDDLWYYRHVHAARTKVAVFDERVFRKLSGHDESDILNILERNGDVFGTTAAIAYLHKRIHVFTIISDKHKCKYTILGFDHVSVDEMKSRIVKIGEINISDNGETILEFETDNSFYKNYIVGKFDYVSIHQGLLDKVYEGISGRMSNVDNKIFNILRCGLTTQIKKQMCKSDNSKILIHSGRSMPSERDMPQRDIPFVQYANIENALDDAKLTLVDLLDFARCD